MKFDNQNELDERHRKEEQNKEANKVYCKGCKRVIFPVFQCGCSGGGGGSGSGNEGTGEEATKNQAPTFESLKKAKEYEVYAVMQPQTNSIQNIGPSDELLRQSFERLARLVELGAVEIKDDKENLTLTIRQLSQLSKEDQKILFDCMNAIRKAYCEFANENGLTIKEDPIQCNTLIITIQNPQLYEKFIHQLEIKGMLPKAEALLREQPEDLKDSDQLESKSNTKFHPVPKPKGAK